MFIVLATILVLVLYQIQVIYNIMCLRAGFYESKQELVHSFIPFSWLYDEILKLMEQYKKLD